MTVDRHEKCLHSRCSRMAKTKTFQLWCQLLIFSFLKFFIFDFLSYFSFLCTKVGASMPFPWPPFLSHFTSNKNLIRSKPNICKGRKKAQRLDYKMFHNKNKKISINNAQFTPKHRLEQNITNSCYITIKHPEINITQKYKIAIIKTREKRNRKCFKNHDCSMS